ncbi:Rqc2 family fibronectin-binding protein [Paenibacillus sp.]|uniref:Rqc2 family fibronectin-binding protein n=1 Tax=Paenibacillus sp. TaxID=58172 RepID=UPI002D59C9B6|nr:NFACT RNA binding domain-containing protein [Paenibacillus sp.]HZG54961.1 NFACT RNA binding domain-containing protein [Paenibacillus sp.]
MAFDGLVVRAVVQELQPFVGGRIHKIHQPNDSDLVFTLRGSGTTRRLLVSANPTYPRFHLTERAYVNPLEAPMFCMLLRKYCENGVVESIEQLGMERIVHIQVRQRDELGDVGVKRIVFELMGRHSNIVLMDPESGVVLEAAHRVTPAISAHRIVVPGAVYTPPPEQEKRNPLEVSKRDIADALGADAGDPGAAAQRLVETYSGISPLAARAILAGASDPAAAFADAMARIRSHEYEPNIATEPGRGKSYFSVVPLRFAFDGAVVETFDNVSACLERYYGDKAERDLVKQRTSDLAKLLANERSKNEKKLEKLADTLEEARDADRYRVFGELLNAYMHTFAKGADAVEVANYYDEAQASVTIPLDPLLTPSENAQRYFKKYQKMKNSLAVVEEQMAQAREEIAYMELLLQQLEGASLQDIEEIRAELVEGGYLRHRGGKDARRARKNDKPAVHAYESSEGVPIYVGRNNAQNDYITNRLARPSDTWLHTKDIPGSHVVIRGDAFGDVTLAEAANLAAYYSKAKQSSLVPVDYTLVRHVKKPSGAKPGFVIYDKQKTLFVTPDEARVRALRPLK